jgi:hypothetical protein
VSAREGADLRGLARMCVDVHGRARPAGSAADVRGRARPAGSAANVRGRACKPCAPSQLHGLPSAAPRLPSGWC